MTPGKNIALTRLTLAGKVMSLLFNMLSRVVIDFLPRSKELSFFLVVGEDEVAMVYQIHLSTSDYSS